MIRILVITQGCVDEEEERRKARAGIYARARPTAHTQHPPSICKLIESSSQGTVRAHFQKHHRIGKRTFENVKSAFEIEVARFLEMQNMTVNL